MVIFTLALFMILGTFTGNATLSFILAMFIPVAFIVKWVATADSEKGIISADIIGLVLSGLFLFGVLINV